MMGNTDLNQFFTPAWATQRIVEHFYPDLAGKRVIEPSCGDGRFLMALPDACEAVGVEIDPVMAERARLNSGREVIEGDFSSVDLPFRPEVIVGNPPFSSDIIDSFLDRGYDMMDYGGEIGFILPVYLFQTASRVLRYHERFSLDQVLMPRNMFQGMQKPLMFARFKKERQRNLVGFFLYGETQAVLQLKKQYRLMFVGNESRASLWGEVVERALIALGGEASLDAIYTEIEGKRPYEGNSFWKQQVRKVLQRCAVRVARGRYALARQGDLFAAA
jgi:site-specific DNA-methyltransferase (adenine-specific)